MSRRCIRLASASDSMPTATLSTGPASTVPGIVCLGSIRQGELWETTAIPEIRSQAVAIAELIAGDARVRPTRAPRTKSIAPNGS